MRTAFVRMICTLLLALVVTGPSIASEDRYWDLGVGCYYNGTAGVSDLDVARYDWIYVCFGNLAATEEAVTEINRLLAINPNLKVVLRVWPIMGKGDRPENRHQATFLHYLYDDGIRERVNQSIHDQVRVVLDNIAKRESVVGLTFLEELPGHFSGRPFGNNEAGELTWDLERFRTEIEAERGKPLVWDDETRRWWGRKWTDALAGVHRAMKDASGGLLVWYYQQTNHLSLDMVPEGTPLNTRNLVPIRFGDIIKPGLCDGFFAYPNTRAIWDRYLKLAKDNDWIFFSQVSHPGRMRGCAWDDCLGMAAERTPHNMGCFLYCSGDCAVNRAWNDDPAVPDGAEWNTRYVSQKLHWRRTLRDLDVGMDIVRAQPAIRLQADLPLGAAKSGDHLALQVVVENTREASFYADATEAVARSVSLTVEAPRGFRLEPREASPARVSLGDLRPGERRIVRWQFKVTSRFRGTLSRPFTVTARPATVTARPGGSLPTVLALSVDTTVPFGQPLETGISGAEWVEVPFRLPEPELRPAIEILAVRGPVRNPSIECPPGSAGIVYQGTLEDGARLVLDPHKGSRLFLPPLLDDDGSARTDEDDPTGFRGVNDGYLIHRIRVGKAVRPELPLRLTMAGKVAGGERSHVILRFARTEGHQDIGALTNRLSDKWRQVSAPVTPPQGAVSLEWIYLYRLKQSGTAWYGPVRVERADVPRAGKDVSNQVQGTSPVLRRGELHTLRYRDAQDSTIRPRVQIRLIVP